jgi:Skp family chaperone for outer membrane proteins
VTWQAKISIAAIAIFVFTLFYQAWKLRRAEQEALNDLFETRKEEVRHVTEAIESLDKAVIQKKEKYNDEVRDYNTKYHSGGNGDDDGNGGGAA